MNRRAWCETQRASSPVAVLAVTLCAIGSAQGRKAGAPAKAGAELALQLADFAALPVTGSPDGTGNNAGSLARVNFLRGRAGAHPSASSLMI